jgi:TyrR family helix-turn-helix protein
MAEYLTAYRWPGNVRQLRNCLYRAMTLLEGDEIGPEHVDLPVAADAMPLIDEWFEGGLDEAVKRFESRLLERLYPAFPSTHHLAITASSPHHIAHQGRGKGIIRRTAQRNVPTHFRRHVILNGLQRGRLGGIVAAGKPSGDSRAAAKHGGQCGYGRHTAQTCGHVHQDSPPSASSLI